MTEQEAIKILEGTYTTTGTEREVLSVSIQALKNEQRRKELIEKYQESYDNPELQYDEDMSKIVLAVLKECECGDGSSER